MKTAQEWVAMQKVGQGQKCHPLMMGHICFNYNSAPALSLSLPAEIDGLVIAVISEHRLTGKQFEILHRLIRRNIQSQKSCIRGYNQLFIQAAL